MSQTRASFIDYVSLDIDSATLIEIVEQHPRLFGARAASGRPLGVHFPRGWVGVFRRLCAALDTALPNNAPPLEEVRSKYAALNVVHSWSPAIDDLVTEYELESERACEVCGQPARQFADAAGWVRTLCPVCAAQQGYESGDGDEA